ncbi:hypothetical protein GGI20_006181, partial [Coemansia sp. BCRC 34301]
MDTVSRLYAGLKESPFVDSVKQANMLLLRRKARGLMVFAGMVQFRMPSDTYAKLNRMDPVAGVVSSPGLATAVRRYLVETNNMDASPLLGTREYNKDTASRPLEQSTDIGLHIRIVALANNTNSLSSGAFLDRQSGALKSQLSLLSPLVLAPATAANTPSPAAATVVALERDRSSSGLNFGLRVALRKTTVEDLARAIESAYCSQSLFASGSSLSCAALFRGDQPLLFGSRVRDVLRDGDSVIVYGSINQLSEETYSCRRRRSDIGGDSYHSTTQLPDIDASES